MPYLEKNFTRKKITRVLFLLKRHLYFWSQFDHAGKSLDSSDYLFRAIE